MARNANISAQELHAMQSENQSETIRFRVTPSLKKQFEESLRELGVKDLSTFARGAFLNAIELAKLGRDPRWREFIAAANAGPAKEILGHGLTLPDALDIEGLGKERKGLTVDELKLRLAKRRKNAGAKTAAGTKR